MDHGLGARLVRTVTDLGVLANRVAGQLDKALGTGDDAYLDAIALNLQAFYTGAEQAFEAIAVHLDGGLPPGQHWHRDLLVQMSCAVDDIRPAVIADDTLHALDRYRRFRHVVRNVYSMNLESEQVVSLARELPTALAHVDRDVRAFVEFLRGLDDVD